MAQKGVQLDREAFSCSICLDLLKDPVTTPCGHNYCMNCIKSHWDVEDCKYSYSCPQCRKRFTSRPDLLKNNLLADLVEELKKTGLQAAPADHCYAGAEDVACDVCTGRKLKAHKSCLQCLASFCEKHLQFHYESETFKKHKLVEPSKKLQENVCSRHDEVMKMFCRTDQQLICYLCSVDEHKGHDTVSAAAERAERQRELEGSRQNIQQRIQDREKDVKLLQQQAEAINVSADKAVEDSEKIFTELIRLLEKRSSDVKQQVRSQQKREVSRVKELQEKLEQEITELKRKDAELKKLSHTEDHNQFLHNYPSLSPLSQSTSSIHIRPMSCFEDVTAAVSEVRDKLQDVLREKWTKVSLTGTEVDKQRTEVDRLKTEVDKLKQQQLVRQVAFSASLVAGSQAVTIGPFPSDTLLIYKHVPTNIGNAYNSNTGVFTAPVRGAYHFEWWVAAHGDNGAHASAAVLVKNSENVFMAYERQTQHFGTSSNGVTLLLEVGDVVFVRLVADTLAYDNANHHTTFSGFLLFPM
ncbi:E3 ubiquitin/ISG15 ligase TRIM25-like isoform X3 [Sander lucioperca]|uniref:E3 ubiquitin/ISG15 ligase TRIM25-like isoform X3 n=1 Tax=Sander lucioperca TaxID=283035 RepID=UPI00165349D3|nr:E3 ubiquitin/ISG15 ligase TRIM25-like isoform X3 [Sander lucioperca]